jgi:hypothetical protein
LFSELNHRDESTLDLLLATVDQRCNCDYADPKSDTDHHGDSESAKTCQYAGTAPNEQNSKRTCNDEEKEELLGPVLHGTILLRQGEAF